MNRFFVKCNRNADNIDCRVFVVVVVVVVVVVLIFSYSTLVQGLNNGGKQNMHDHFLVSDRSVTWPSEFALQDEDFLRYFIYANFRSRKVTNGRSRTSTTICTCFCSDNHESLSM